MKFVACSSLIDFDTLTLIFFSNDELFSRDGINHFFLCFSWSRGYQLCIIDVAKSLLDLNVNITTFFPNLK